MKIRYTPEAARCILRLHPEIKRRVRRAIADLLADPLRGHELRLEAAHDRLR
ncbi:MAG: type II toxin-antitoxin system RelE family toxin [Gammaproteobacteria bacterium]